MRAKRIVVNVQTGEQYEEEFEFTETSPPPPPPDPDEELAKAIEAATTLDELKAALLGRLGKAKVAGRLKST